VPQCIGIAQLGEQRVLLVGSFEIMSSSRTFAHGLSSVRDLCRCIPPMAAQKFGPAFPKIANLAITT
jgi:hypothetical protein